MKWPATGPLRLPSISQRIRSARTLSGGEAELSQSRPGIAIALAKDTGVISPRSWNSRWTVALPTWHQPTWQLLNNVSSSSVRFAANEA